MTKRQEQILLVTWFVAWVAVLRIVLFFQHMDQSLDLEQGYVLEVTPGTNFTRIVADLQDKGILVESSDLVHYARLQGSADQIKAGEYELEVGMTSWDLLDLLVSGRVIYHRITLVEGWTLRQAILQLHAHPALVAKLDPDDPLALQAAFQTAQYPEGLFLPETYHFTRGTSDIEILERARGMMQDVLAQAWESRAPNLPLNTPEEALVLASIIEKETALASEYTRIAGVFTRRLQSNMRLQTDPTVIYGLGLEFDGNLTRAQLQLDTPWNTYTRHGLPPTPIALPGRAAIHASVQPDDASALYFVSRGDGSHHFSDTLTEHNRAVRQYQLGIDQP